MGEILDLGESIFVELRVPVLAPGLSTDLRTFDQEGSTLKR